MNYPTFYALVYEKDKCSTDQNLYARDEIYQGEKWYYLAFEPDHILVLWFSIFIKYIQ